MRPGDEACGTDRVIPVTVSVRTSGSPGGGPFDIGGRPGAYRIPKGESANKNGLRVDQARTCSQGIGNLLA
jgi:predicted NUDIX family NTP pyrophosphohydrolase